jgi:hypothetical protein
MDYPLIAQLGVAGVVFGALFFLLKWMTRLHDKVMTDSKEERIAWQALILSFSSRFQEQSMELRNMTEQNNEAHKYQREEHKEILNNQRKIIDEQNNVKRELEQK